MQFEMKLYETYLKLHKINLKLYETKLNHVKLKSISVCTQKYRFFTTCHVKLLDEKVVGEDYKYDINYSEFSTADAITALALRNCI